MSWNFLITSNSILSFITLSVTRFCNNVSKTMSLLTFLGLSKTSKMLLKKEPAFFLVMTTFSNVTIFLLSLSLSLTLKWLHYEIASSPRLKKPTILHSFSNSHSSIYTYMVPIKNNNSLPLKYENICLLLRVKRYFQNIKKICYKLK